MKSLFRTLAVAAFAVVVAGPAYAQLNTNQAGAYGTVQLRSGFEPDPHDVSVDAGGTIDASSINSDCIGMVADRADVTLRYTRGDLPLILSVTSDADTTLVVRAPNGQWYCNDDGEFGLNPSVRFDSPRSGRYQIWVGTFGSDGGTPPAVLHISELRAVGGETAGGGGDVPDFSLEPAYGSVDLAAGFTPDPHTISIAAGGELDASAIQAPGCVGRVARAPDYRVNWTAGSGGRPLIFSVASDADTTIVVNDAQGNWLCDDDGGNNGLNPAITIQNPSSGQYDVWVGTYEEGGLQDSTLNVSELYSQ
ncbi:hypothetical protein [Terricaulis sp.]|uniref:hypothetical protein n=1 Tax=Terricaulis sp. TaxID=2768686 RepID=UPI003782F279